MKAFFLLAAGILLGLSSPSAFAEGTRGSDAKQSEQTGGQEQSGTSSGAGSGQIRAAAPVEGETDTGGDALRVEAPAAGERKS